MGNRESQMAAATPDAAAAAAVPADAITAAADCSALSPYSSAAVPHRAVCDQADTTGRMPTSPNRSSPDCSLQNVGAYWRSQGSSLSSFGLSLAAFGAPLAELDSPLMRSEASSPSSATPPSPLTPPPTTHRTVGSSSTLPLSAAEVAALSRPRIHPILRGGRQISDDLYWVLPPRSKRRRDQKTLPAEDIQAGVDWQDQRTYGPGRTPLDLVRGVTGRVFGVTDEESHAALSLHRWDTEAAVRYLKIEQLFRLGLSDRQACRTLLDSHQWHLEAACAAAAAEAAEAATEAAATASAVAETASAEAECLS